MEFLVFLLIVIFVFVSEGKKGKKGGKGKRRGSLNLREQFESFKERAEQDFREVVEVPEPVDDEIEEEYAPEPEPVFDQGVSPMDDEGCVGGSMEHVHTEGETHEEHRRHVEILRQREREETLAAEAATELAEMNLQKLRRAVVMAEILDKPVSLRRRRCGGQG